MVVQRGEIWWADLAAPIGSGPKYRRPIQSDAFNRSRIGTVIVATITTNVELATAPGNVFLAARSSGLRRESVVNVSQVLTIDRGLLGEMVGPLAVQMMAKVTGYVGCEDLPDPDHRVERQTRP